MMAAPGTHSRSRFGAPDDGCRMMIASAPTERSVLAVSFRDSPFFTLELDAETLMTSALIHLPAVSNEDRVRVEFS